ncbi:MAG TPA: hypothetical protein VFT75_18330 [Nocardioidaceae bacterium]|nr:hypothetical protein [Nocardioidaceae bacterium]
MSGGSPIIGHVLEIAISGGCGAALLGLITTIYKRITGRNKEQVDAAKIVQAMALDMVKPLHEELDRVYAQLQKVRGQSAEMRDEFDKLLAWARAANRELTNNGLSVGPIPVRLARPF